MMAIAMTVPMSCWQWHSLITLPMQSETEMKIGDSVRVHIALLIAERSKVESFSLLHIRNV